MLEIPKALRYFIKFNYLSVNILKDVRMEHQQETKLSNHFYIIVGSSETTREAPLKI
jgi:hypothetical protein